MSFGTSDTSDVPLERVPQTTAEERAFREPAPAPDYWPTNMMPELSIAQSIRSLIDPSNPDNDFDMYDADSIIAYGLRLQAISGNGAELMARMRMAKEKRKTEAIQEAMTSEKVDFSKFKSVRLQQDYIDGLIAVHLAAYEYCEFLNKRISYAMEFIRSLLSFRKEEMYHSRPIPQR